MSDIIIYQYKQDENNEIINEYDIVDNIKLEHIIVKDNNIIFKEYISIESVDLNYNSIYTWINGEIFHPTYANNLLLKSCGGIYGFTIPYNPDNAVGNFSVNSIVLFDNNNCPANINPNQIYYVAQTHNNYSYIISGEPVLNIDFLISNQYNIDINKIIFHDVGEIWNSNDKYLILLNYKYPLNISNVEIKSYEMLLGQWYGYYNFEYEFNRWDTKYGIPLLFTTEEVNYDIRDNGSFSSSSFPFISQNNLKGYWVADFQVDSVDHYVIGVVTRNYDSDKYIKIKLNNEEQILTKQRFNKNGVNYVFHGFGVWLNKNINYKLEILSEFLEFECYEREVLNIQTEPPTDPQIGDKYLVSPTGSGAWSSISGYGEWSSIATYNGTDWEFELVNQFTQKIYVKNLNDNKYYVFKHKNPFDVYEEVINIKNFANYPPPEPEINDKYVIMSPTGWESYISPETLINNVQGAIAVFNGTNWDAIIPFDYENHIYYVEYTRTMYYCMHNYNNTLFYWTEIVNPCFIIVAMRTDYDPPDIIDIAYIKPISQLEYLHINNKGYITQLLDKQNINSNNLSCNIDIYYRIGDVTGNIISPSAINWSLYEKFPPIYSLLDTFDNDEYLLAIPINIKEYPYKRILELNCKLNTRSFIKNINIFNIQLKFRINK